MCGICVSLLFRKVSASDHLKTDSSLENLFARLKRRGPNHFQEVTSSFHSVLDLHFISSILHLRGSSPALQPVVDSSGNILLWNGEIFGGVLFEELQSDVKLLSSKLSYCSESSNVISLIASVEGPFAFVYYQSNGLLWFGRDIFGRRSLLFRADNVAFHICSIPDSLNEWKEVPAGGIFCLDLKESKMAKSFVLNLYPWSSSPSGLCLSQQIDQISIPNIPVTVKSEISVRSSISIFLNRSLPSEEVLENFDIPKKNTKTENCFESDVFENFLKITIMSKTVAEFEEVLSNGVKKRVENHQHMCKKCYAVQSNELKCLTCDHASVGVLFSGGLDSIVIACLADRHLIGNQPIDLINVAFASNASLKNSKAIEGNPAFETPDRVTGRNGAMALQRVCPKRTWNFIEVNVTEEDLVKSRREVISHLLSPSCTVLDDSIGCALWFAARGEGVIGSNGGYKNYSSSARVLLVGMGADEQLGGYARHRSKFSSSGWFGLIEELSLELDRIGSRNLGRDDRIIADNGVESRYPFLDENVVSFLNNLPVWLKMNLNYPRGIGEKLVLRLLAFKLGLHEAAALPKRAIQFGSRIARIENSKEKGSDLCERLKVL